MYRLPHLAGKVEKGSLMKMWIKRFDAIGIWSGKAVAWLILPMVLGLSYEVIMRYMFNAPTAWAYDLTFILYGTLFMTAAAFTLQRKGHIRTDMFYGNWSVRTQGTVDTVCYVLFFFPGLLAFFYVGWEFFEKSWEQGERIVTSTWMPIIWPFKFVLPLSTFLLLVQGIAELMRSVHAARKGEWI
jgi:TRAP-type mannitol/chloroaromatic compound transport system permease small subunit